MLAIAAARLGFGPVVAIDDDEAAVAATQENATRNGVSIDARVLDALHEALPAADVALANIALDVVTEVVPRLQCDRIVLSGYLDRDRRAPSGLRHLDRRTAAGWAADLYARE